MQRRDARDNRARILASADEVFGTGGPAASTEEVARRAGVGIATVFRHFPTKVDLLTAVLADRLTQLGDRAGVLMDAPDPGAAFVDFFTEVVEGATTKITIAEALSDAGVTDGGVADGGLPDPVGEAGKRLHRAFGDLLARAQEAGAVRPDVGAPEAYALMVGTSRAVAFGRLPDDVRDRMLAVVFDGLRRPAG